ncbi:MAG TPA: amidohydrolase family protein, partial [Ilumatobacteraceae bacterium]|nr:amidohydrolase family protein [Ilumatobacteraceae bacterium]
FYGVNPESDIERILTHPLTIMTFSDSGAHVSQICDSSIQTYLLAYWVREREVLSLERAVRDMTLLPSMVWGFGDRGLVREGFVADLNVIDPNTVCPGYVDGLLRHREENFAAIFRRRRHACSSPAPASDPRCSVVR